MLHPRGQGGDIFVNSFLSVASHSAVTPLLLLLLSPPTFSCFLPARRSPSCRYLLSLSLCTQKLPVAKERSP